MSDEPLGERARFRIDEASVWFARMRGPDAEGLRETFETWIADPDNARAYTDIETIWSTAGAARRVQVPARGRETVTARHRSWIRPVLAVAALVFAVAALALVLSGYGRSFAPEPPLAAYASAVGQVRNFVLPDGSRVTLDTASRIALSFSPRERRVTLLAGRARFEVAHEGRPFLVLANGRAVIARGTVFDVRLEDDGLEVLLLEGTVDITGAASMAKAGAVRLVPGERAVARGGDAIRVEATPPPLASWTQGFILADGMALGDLVTEANRYSPTRIVLVQPELGRLRVTGAFQPGNAGALGVALAAALDLSVTTRADGSVLLARGPI